MRKLGTTPTCTTCNSESVFSAMSIAFRAASSASSEPSVASRTLVGKMLIATLSFPVSAHRGTCANCINTLAQRKETKTAQGRSGGATEAYSPECMEGGFFESLPRKMSTWLATWQMYRASRAATVSAGPVPLCKDDSVPTKTSVLGGGNERTLANWGRLVRDAPFTSVRVQNRKVF